MIAPGDLARSWPWDPASVVLIAAAAAAWVVAVRRGPRPPGSIWWWSGLAVLAVALLSPLDELGDQLMTAHMLQHWLIGLIAPLLLVRSRPGRVLGRLVDAPTRRAGTRWVAPALRSGGVLAAAVILQVAAWWSWHLPSLYDAALANDRIHALEHLTLFATGLLLWSVTWPAGPVRQRGGLAVLALFATAFAIGPLAAILTLADQAHYATSAATATAWGMDPLADQQLAGVVMWVPGGLVYLAVAMAVFSSWLAHRAPRDPGLTPDRVVIAER